MTDVRARIAAAYAADRAGDERGAIVHYDAAWALGVPADQRRSFLVGYGSTLRNVGRVDDAVALLADAVAAEPTYAPLHAFLALALLDAGQPRAALGAMLGALLDHAPAALDGYDRALGAYHAALLAPPAR